MTTVVYSCSSNNDKTVLELTPNEINNSTTETTTSSKTKANTFDTITNTFFRTLFQQIIKIRTRTSGEWRYDALPFSCYESNNVKCYKFSYDAYVLDCFDILEKPCLEKFLIVKTQRSTLDNPNLDKIVDSTETIISFQLFTKNKSIRNSSIIGKHIEEFEGKLGTPTYREENKLSFQVQQGKFDLYMISDTVRSITFSK